MCPGILRQRRSSVSNEETLSAMTLNITLLTSEVIYQAADYRLYDVNSKRPERQPSTKAIIFQNPDWTGFVTYTGIGRVGTTHTGEFVRDWVDNRSDLSFREVAERIQSAAGPWILRYAPGSRQTFVVAGFVEGSPEAAVISNFERWHGAEEDEVSSVFFESTVRLKGRPEVVVTGCRHVVPRHRRRVLKRQAEKASVDPARIRRALADVIREGAESEPDLISADCFVYSQDRHGRGHEETFGHVRTDLPHVLPDSARQAVESLLDDHFGEGAWTMKSGTFARSGSNPEPPQDCVLTLSTLPVNGRHEIVQLVNPEGRRATPRAVNSSGLIVGEATPRGQDPSYPAMWRDVTSLVFLPHFGGLGGQALSVNESGVIVGHSETSDRASTACVWRLDGSVEDIGSRVGSHSGAVTINASGDIGGWVSIHAVEGGQAHFRPAFWARTGNPVILEDLDGGWGQVVDMNENGIALVRVHHGPSAEAGLWDGVNLNMLGQLSPEVRSFYPKRLTADGGVVGTAIMRSSKREIATWDQRDGWGSLGAASHDRELSGASTIPPQTLVGDTEREDFRVPWLWDHATNQYGLIPHYVHHHHHLSHVSNEGLIVGNASSDRCSHPLLWTPS